MKVFLGSSSESKEDMLKVAQWVEEAGHTPRPWSDPSLFLPGDYIFSKIIEICKDVDAAILIFGEDDQIWYRTDLQSQPRDNVLIEYGLFAGAIGTENTIICRKGKPRTPSDLGGVIFADLNKPVDAQIRILNWLKGLKPKHKQDTSQVPEGKSIGLHRILAVSGAMGTHREWMERLKNSEHNVDLMGYTLHVWTRGENFEEEMQALVKAGVHARVLIMDENNPNLPALVNEGQIYAISLNAVREEIKATRRTFGKIAEELRATNPAGKFEFRVLGEGLIVTQICRTDSDLTAVQYLYSVVASRSPLLEVKGTESELFKIYMEEFEKLWALATKAS